MANTNKNKISHFMKIKRWCLIQKSRYYRWKTIQKIKKYTSEDIDERKFPEVEIPASPTISNIASAMDGKVSWKQKYFSWLKYFGPASTTEVIASMIPSDVKKTKLDEDAFNGRYEFPALDPGLEIHDRHCTPDCSCHIEPVFTKVCTQKFRNSDGKLGEDEVQIRFNI